MTDKILLRGGCVLTLGDRTPNLTQADVLIDGEVIAEVGNGVRARDAEQIDAADTIVMPGFVDTHRHAAHALFRNIGTDGFGEGAPATSGRRLGPDDVYAATLVGLLGALEAGITTVVDRSTAALDDGAAEAALRAHGDAGPSTDVALGTELPAADPDLDAVRAWGDARAAGARIHAHGGAGRPPAGAIAALAAIDALGRDVTLVHCSELTDEDADAISRAGASVSLAPASEMALGAGPPPIQQLIDRDIRPGLGTDEERLAPGDLFAQMRATISMQHATVFDRKLAGKAGLPRLMTTRDVIRFATIDGARAAGLGDVTGSLEPGKRADVVVLRTDRPNIFPVNDPIGAVVWGMDTSNVDHVFVGGRALVRGGVLQADASEARRLATEAQRRVLADAGLVAGAAGGGEA